MASLPPIDVPKGATGAGAFDAPAAGEADPARFDYLLPNGDFGRTIARQLLFSTWQHLLYQRLAGSSDGFLRDIAAKAVKEVAYHRELASEWTVRLCDGTDESGQRMRDGLDWCWRFVPELFEVDELLEELIARGIAADPRSFEEEYRSAIGRVLADAKIDAPAEQRPIL